MGLFGNFFNGKSNQATYFRNLKNMFDITEIKGLESVTDERIIKIYNMVKNTLETIATKRNEVVSEQAINGIVRDCLIDEVNGCFQQNFDTKEEWYSQHGLGSLFIKGRTYS